MKSRTHILLVIIVTLAFLLRFWQLAKIPVGFNDDEAAFGYNAYSILKTGRDEWGRLLPFPAFESFGDWKLSGYFYLTVISEAIFGLNEFATRFPSALFGVAAVFTTYLLATRLFNKRMGLLASLLLAISPWHIVASRNAFESDLLVFFTSLAAYFFLKFEDNKKYLLVSLVIFCASFYIYRSSWVFVPLFVLWLAIVFNKSLFKIKKELVWYSLLSIILLLPLLPSILSFSGQSRFLQESFITGISRVGIINEINEKRGICTNHVPSLFCSLIYNKFLAFGTVYINSYTQNLSIKNFFEKANIHGFQSFSERSTFYFFELPLLGFGVISLLKAKGKSSKIILGWFIIAPIGASVTGSGNFGRLNIIMPAPQIISAFALIKILDSLKKIEAKVIFSLFCAGVIAFSIVKFSVDTFFIEPFYTSRYQRYGYKELFGYIKQNESQYDNILISHKIDYSHQYIQYLFSSKVDPHLVQTESERTHDNGGWVVFSKIGKYNFVPSLPDLNTRPKSLIVVGESEIPSNDQIYTIRDIRGDIIFKIYNSSDLVNTKEDK